MCTEGVQGNERLDEVTDCAVVEEGQPMDHNDIVKNLRKEDFKIRQLISLLRMKEMGIKTCAAKRETFTGRKKD
jgi:hypothetical protein